MDDSQKNLLIVDIDAFLDGDMAPCFVLRKGLETHSAILFRDSRVPDPTVYTEMMADYFAQPRSTLMQDVRRKAHYEVGFVPPGVERARDHTVMLQTWPPELWPHMTPFGYRDPKLRFMHQFCDPGVKPKFDPVIPKAFSDRWETVSNAWGQGLVQSVKTLMHMLALAYDLEVGAFLKVLEGTTHLLAPNAMNLDLPEIVEGLVLNQFHYDFALGAAHGPSTAPGLRIWVGNKWIMDVKVPPGLFLFQAGKQLEHLTGGRVLAGFHEVVVLAGTLVARERLRAAGRRPYRVGTTVFVEGAWWNELRVLDAFLPEDPFLRQQVLRVYRTMQVCELVTRELVATGMMRKIITYASRPA